jgi:uncharacterized protein YecE (DUF72 family)
MKLLAGTSGYSYKEWLGRFYPEKWPASDMLRYYAGRFPTVEINNTFYRMPAPSMLAQWLDQVPADFSFSVKAPRRITHIKRLNDAQSDVTELLRRCEVLGDRLGVFLFQLPPFLRKDVTRLSNFLDTLPRERPIAFEFRNDTWQDAEVYDALRERNAMLCVTDTDEGDTPFVITTPERGYVRLRRTHYDDDDLRGWIERIAAAGADKTYVYFMHEDEALGTRFAQRLRELWVERRGIASEP